MERILRLFNKEFSKISEAALVLAFFTLLSQILAIFRDRFLAGNIGTGEILDVYYAAFRVPDLLFTLGASLVSVSVLMPFFMDRLSSSKKDALKFVNDVFTTFFFFIVVLSIISWILMPWITHLFFPGFTGLTLEKTIMISRIMLLSPILLGISNLFATITQAYRQFFVYAIAPIFYNLGIILGVTLFYNWFGIIGLAYGVGFGALLHMLIQLPVIARHGLIPKISFTIDWVHIKQILKHSLPRTITLSMSKIVFLVFVSLASTLVSGTISVFNLSYNLQSVPLAIIGVSYSVAAFPILVDYFNNNNYEKFLRHVMIPIRQIVFWSLPVISLFVVLRAQIVRVILGTGNFDWSDTKLTAASLALFIISVTAQSIILLLVRAYYAAGKTWRPLWITLFSSGMTVIFAFMFTYLYNNNLGVKYFFELLLRIENVEGSSVIMLSLAYSVGMFLNLILLWSAFKKDFPFNYNYGISRSFLESAFASLIIGAVVYFVLNTTDSLFRSETVLGVLGHGALSGFSGIFIGFIFLRLIKNQEIMMFTNLIYKKAQKMNFITDTSSGL
jgi:putative peptidoglycan lipid II flippase